MARTGQEATMSLQIPESLRGDHDSLRARMRRAMREEGKTGEFAREIMQVMEGHMMREEKFALKPLGLLKILGRGERPRDLADALEMVRGLKREMPQMIDEHRQIAELLRRMASAAGAEGTQEYVALAEDIILHAHLEEDVLYPAAMLVGEYAALALKD
jgi:iron-sulfur cluster repair protein YtfE (RIC family)